MRIAGLPLARDPSHVQGAAQAAPNLDALHAVAGLLGPVDGLVVPVRPVDGAADQRQAVRVAGVLDIGGALAAVQVGRLDAIEQRIGPEQFAFSGGGSGDMVFKIYLCINLLDYMLI